MGRFTKPRAFAKANVSKMSANYISYIRTAICVNSSARCSIRMFEACPGLSSVDVTWAVTKA